MRDFGNLEFFVHKMRELETIVGKKHHISEEFAYLNKKFKNRLKEIKNINYIHGKKEKICFAVCVWGTEHLRDLDNVTMDSLFSNHQTQDLKSKFELIFYLQIGNIHENQKKEFLEKYRHLFHKVIVMDITEETSKLEKFKKLSKYDLLGYLQSLQVLLSKHINADLFPFLPDLYYSAFYIKKILEIGRKKQKAVIQPAFRSTKVGYHLINNLKKTTGQKLIQANRLAKIAFQTIAPESEQWVLKKSSFERGIFPNSHMVLIHKKNGIAVFSPHFHCNFFPLKIIKRIKERFYFTLDSELDLLCPKKADLYFPTKQNIYCAHFSKYSKIKEQYFKIKFKNKNKTLLFLISDLYQHRRNHLLNIFQEEIFLPFKTKMQCNDTNFNRKVLGEIFELLKFYQDKIYTMTTIVQKQGFYERI